ncbi:uncharacterized protein LOC127864378 [Dreissena polymorpha]|uniref:Uncharacterized protein n=1 Tax=Dreissena polymorpha TaxID=45954 RepID=A0A9D4NL41_DREPO|nr:uncharacterized protein LOC127864378 [Dreissena polymorpha]KAH3896290.1 hypothetical protein DPMN_020465 [Dreissena polymorpha]
MALPNENSLSNEHSSLIFGEPLWLLKYTSIDDTTLLQSCFQLEADTTLANAVSSDGNLSTGAIIAISAGSGVISTLIVVAVSFKLFRSLRIRKSRKSDECHRPVNHTLDDTHTASSHIKAHYAHVYEYPCRDGDHDDHVYHGIIQADSTDRELVGFETTGYWSSTGWSFVQRLRA